MAKTVRTKRIKRYFFTEAQEAALKEHEQIHGTGRHAAKLALKLAAFRYPGAPKRTIGGLANKLNKIHKERIASKLPKSKFKETVSDAFKAETLKKLSFRGFMTTEDFEITISGNTTDLKGLF